jgi:predicted small metal-binding protein
MSEFRTFPHRICAQRLQLRTSTLPPTRLSRLAAGRAGSRNEGRFAMAKVFKCRDIGVACDFEARAETEPELMQKLVEHARTAHNLREIPQDVVERVKAAVREE